MGVIGDAFKKLFEIIWQAITWIAEFIGNVIQVVVDAIKFLIELIVGLIEGLLYLIYMIGVLAVKLFLVIFEAAKILYSLAVGFARTLGSLSYSSRGSGGNGYSDMLGQIFEKLTPLQITPIAYILMFALWYMTAISAMKIISSIRVGGD